MSILNLDTLDPNKTEPTEDKIVSDDHVETEVTTHDPVEVSSGDDPEQQTVIMDGPLSKIYTQALNLVYAKEAASASGQTDIKVLFDEDIESSTEYHDALYVYCCDAGDMDINDALEGSNKLRLALDNKNIKSTYMVMESHRIVKPAAGLLEEYAVSSGVKVIFKRNIAIETICDALKR